MFKVVKPVVVFGDHTKIFKYIDFDFVLGADGVKILKPVNDIETKFFYYSLLGSELKSLGYARHYRLLKELSILVPPIDEQKKIIVSLEKVFNKIEKLINNVELKIRNLEEMKKSFLIQILAGE